MSKEANPLRFGRERFFPSNFDIPCSIFEIQLTSFFT